MKANIHPKWFENAKVTCACGNNFTVGAAVAKIDVEVCGACHPFYTGQMRYVDTAGRVDAYKERQKQAVKKRLSKAEKRKLKRERKIQKELERPDTLDEVRKKTQRSTKKKEKD